MVRQMQRDDHPRQSETHPACHPFRAMRSVSGRQSGSMPIHAHGCDLARHGTKPVRR
jgi:hypothetical protein